MTPLHCRVYELERQKMLASRSELRSLANGTGDRTDKIRTYNFPQVLNVQCFTVIISHVLLT